MQNAQSQNYGFIDRASRKHTIHQLKHHLTKSDPVILKVGCASGDMLQEVQTHFPKATIIGADNQQEPLDNLAQKLSGVSLVKFDLLDCPLPENHVDAVIMLNVLEHMEQDDIAIQQVYRILKPGGIAIFEVPSGPNLFDIYDKFMLHYRRYNMTTLTSLVQNQNFHVTQKSHLGFFLYPMFFVVKKHNQKLIMRSADEIKTRVENQIRYTGQNKLMHALMQTELFIGRYLRYPFGIRCVMTCKK